MQSKQFAIREYARRYCFAVLRAFECKACASPNISAAHKFAICARRAPIWRNLKFETRTRPPHTLDDVLMCWWLGCHTTQITFPRHLVKFIEIQHKESPSATSSTPSMPLRCFDVSNVSNLFRARKHIKCNGNELKDIIVLDLLDEDIITSATNVARTHLDTGVYMSLQGHHQTHQTFRFSSSSTTASSNHFIRRWKCENETA